MSLAFKWVGKPELVTRARFCHPGYSCHDPKRKQACRDTSEPQFWDHAKSPTTSTRLLTNEIVACCKEQVMEFVWFLW
jgi:hypothetical protein